MTGTNRLSELDRPYLGGSQENQIWRTIGLVKYLRLMKSNEKINKEQAQKTKKERPS